MRHITLLVLMLLPLHAWAYNITGKVIDAENNPMTGAGVALQVDSMNQISSALVDTSGRFVLRTVRTGTLQVKIIMVGYAPTTVEFTSTGKDIDLGEIRMIEAPKELGEITVEGQQVIQRGVHYLLYPTEREISQSGNTLELLQRIQHKLPGLEVNPILGSVKIENGGVVFQINGRKVDSNRVRALNNDNILRVEYTNISDIRYGLSVMGVINFVTKPAAKGGSLNTYLQTFGRNFDGFLSLAYNYKKSEWTADYHNSMRDYRKDYTIGTEKFIGRENIITREQLPSPSGFGYITHDFSTGYTYMPSLKTMFATTFSIQTRSHWGNGNDKIRYTEGQTLMDYLSTQRFDAKDFVPKLDIYFRHSLTDADKVELNLYGNFASGPRDNKLHYEAPELKYDLKTSTENRSSRVGAEAVYTHVFDKMELSGGANYFHNRADNIYRENEGKEQKRLLSTDDLYLHSSLSGRHGPITYSAGLGGKYQKTTSETNSSDAFRLSSKVTLNYKLSPKWTGNYLFMYSPYMPGLAAQTNVVRRIDDLTYAIGNPDLKPSAWMRHRIFVCYADAKWNSSLWASYSHSFKPIYSEYTYMSDPQSPYYNSFMVQSINGADNDRWNLELNVSYTGIKNLTVTAKNGWDLYTFKGLGDKNSLSNFYSYISCSYSLKNWIFFGSYEFRPQYLLEGNRYSTSEQNYSINAQYNYKGLIIGAGVMNPFAPRGFVSYRNILSPVHPVSTTHYMEDGSNLLILKLSYRFRFGEQIKKAKKGLSNTGIDRGIGS